MNIIVIGGGAAGFFAAIRLAEKDPKASVMILERGKEVLQKVRVSGGGRCNVTHACWTPKELVKFYPRGSKALLGPFHKFACGDTMDWFEKRGVKLKIDEDGSVRLQFQNEKFQIPIDITGIYQSKTPDYLVSSDFLSAGCSSFAAFLNSLIPLPNPFINSGIFLPPKSISTTANIIRISVTPNLPMM
jgi:hypothetical protein